MQKSREKQRGEDFPVKRATSKKRVTRPNYPVAIWIKERAVLFKNLSRGIKNMHQKNRINFGDLQFDICGSLPNRLLQCRMEPLMSEHE